MRISDDGEVRDVQDPHGLQQVGLVCASKESGSGVHVKLAAISARCSTIAEVSRTGAAKGGSDAGSNRSTNTDKHAGSSSRNSGFSGAGGGDLFIANFHSNDRETFVT